MAITAAEVPAIADLVRRRSQLKSRIARVAQVLSLDDMAAMFEGTGLENQVLTISKEQVTQYLLGAIAELERQLTAAGVTLEAK